ncbi:complement C1q subcomponent subunit A [Gastrophryne carolinensis]
MMGNFWILLGLLLVGVPRPAHCQSADCQAANGKDGEAGRPGREGRAGQKGDRGEPGDAAHITGLTANKGDTGDPGIPGAPGEIGYKGPEGPPGPPGDHGLKGTKGAMADASDQSRPAFSATFTGFHGNRLLFGNIVTNREKAYDPATGVFTCADPGYYYFTFQVVSQGDLCLQIWSQPKGPNAPNAKKLLSFCDRNSRNQPQVNSGGSVLNLNLGDRVWIEADPKSKKVAEKDSNSVFSGFMLFPRQE